MDDSREHGTYQEKQYLDRIGLHGTIKRPRLEMLEKYKATIPLREKWGKIDTEEIETYVDVLIRIEKNGNGNTKAGRDVLLKSS